MEDSFLSSLTCWVVAALYVVAWAWLQGSEILEQARAARAARQYKELDRLREQVALLSYFRFADPVAEERAAGLDHLVLDPESRLPDQVLIHFLSEIGEEVQHLIDWDDMPPDEMAALLQQEGDEPC